VLEELEDAGLNDEALRECVGEAVELSLAEWDSESS
jgi:hypothetical protein